MKIRLGQNLEYSLSNVLEISEENGDLGNIKEFLFIEGKSKRNMKGSILVLSKKSQAVALYSNNPENFWFEALEKEFKCSCCGEKFIVPLYVDNDYYDDKSEIYYESCESSGEYMIKWTGKIIGATKCLGVLCDNCLNKDVLDRVKIEVK